MAFAKALHALPEGAFEIVEHVISHLLLAFVEHGPMLVSVGH